MAFGQDQFGQAQFGDTGDVAAPPITAQAMSVRNPARGRVDVEWPELLPPDVSYEYILVRSTQGPMQSRSEGIERLRFPATDLRQEYTETGLSGGQYFYAIFFRPTTADPWQILYIGSTYVVGDDHGWANRLFELMPEEVQRQDLARTAQLQRFMAIFEMEFDRARLLIDGLMQLRDATFAPYASLKEAAHDLAMPYEIGLGATTVRRLLDGAFFINARSGTDAGIEAFMEALTYSSTHAVHRPADDSILIYLAPERTNLVPNPSFEVNLTGWTSGGASEIAAVSPDSIIGDNSAQVTNDTGATTDIELSATLDLVGAPQEYMLSAYAMPPSNIGVRVQIEWLDGAAAVISTHVGDTITPTSPTWVRPKVRATLPTTATQVRITIQALQVANLGVVYVDAVMFEQNSDLAAYFDGASIPGDDHRWADAPNGSHSWQHNRLVEKEQRAVALLPDYVHVGQDIKIAHTPAYIVAEPATLDAVEGVGENTIDWTYPAAADFVSPADTLSIQRQRLVTTNAPVEAHPGEFWRERTTIATGVNPALGTYTDTIASPEDYDYRILTVGVNGATSITDWVRSP